MKKLILAALVVIAFNSCATIKVSSDYDNTAKFSEYKTYAFTPESQQLQLDDLNKNRIITAVENEMSLKGFTKSDKPDILIDLKLTAETKETATVNSTGGYGRYGWRGGYSSATVNYDSYKEGTLIVDMVDAVKQQLVWEGRGVGTVNPDASAEKRVANINNAVKMIFTKYPPKVK